MARPDVLRGRLRYRDHLPCVSPAQTQIDDEARSGTAGCHDAIPTQLSSSPLTLACVKAGKVSIASVYVGMGDKIPLGAAIKKGLTIKTGQTHVRAYTRPLLQRIEAGDIDPSFVVTHPASLEDAPAMYKKFRDKGDGPAVAQKKDCP